MIPGDSPMVALQRTLARACLIGALAVPIPALAQGGTVTGTVDVTPAKYLAETVVYLKDVPGQYPPKTVKMDQKGMTFIPHVLAITVGDTVEFLNHDTVDHNVYSTDNEGYNLGVFPAGQSRSYTFKKTGVYTQLCSIHPEMLAFVFVGQNPYSAVVDKTGHYTIKNVPPGSWTLAVWNSHAKAPEQPVTVAAGKTIEANLSLKK